MTAYRRGKWLQHEDRLLLSLVASEEPINWVAISAEIGTRSSKQCYERYQQHLKPGLNHAPITLEEGQLIEHLVKSIGKRWAQIARYLCGRSANSVKNWWNINVHRRQRERRNLQEQITGYKPLFVQEQITDYKPLLVQYPYVASSDSSRDGSQLLRHFEYQPTPQQQSFHEIYRLSGTTTFGENHQPTYIVPPVAQHPNTGMQGQLMYLEKPDVPSTHSVVGGTLSPEMNACNVYSSCQEATEMPHYGSYPVHTLANGDEIGSGTSGLCLRVNRGNPENQAMRKPVEGIAQNSFQGSLRDHSGYLTVGSTKGRMASETMASGLDIRKGEVSREISGRARRRMSLSEVMT